MSLSIFLFTSCSKEESPEQITEQTADSVYVFNLDGKSQTWETITIDELPSKSNVITNRGNGNSAHAHGNFPGVVFSGTENNGGSHGSATANLGPWGFTLETACIRVEGNEAIYDGIVTETTGPPFFVGFHMSFKVIDNGQGNNAPADQFYAGIWLSPQELCDVPLDYGPSFDVPEPGSIKVNN